MIGERAAFIGCRSSPATGYRPFVFKGTVIQYSYQHEYLGVSLAGIRPAGVWQTPKRETSRQLYGDGLFAGHRPRPWKYFIGGVKRSVFHCGSGCRIPEFWDRIRMKYSAVM